MLTVEGDVSIDVVVRQLVNLEIRVAMFVGLAKCAAKTSAQLSEAKYFSTTNNLTLPDISQAGAILWYLTKNRVLGLI